MNKLVSIVIPCYNAHLFIDDLLRSIYKQTYRDFCEVIIVENGSTQDSIKSLKASVEKFSKKLNIIYAEISAASVSTARNKGIELSKGEYITFIDSDDMFAGRYSVEFRVDYLNSHPNVDVVAGYAIKMDKDSKVESSRAPEEVEELYRQSVADKSILPDLYLQYYLSFQKIYFYITGSAMIQNSKLKSTGVKFDPSFDRVEDVEFNISLFDKNFEFSLQKIPFYIKRSHENNLSKNTPQELEDKIINRIRNSKRYAK